MSVDNKGYMKTCGNKGVTNSKYSKKYTARILHAAPGGYPSHVSTGLIPSHSFVMPNGAEELKNLQAKLYYFYFEKENSDFIITI